MKVIVVGCGMIGSERVKALRTLGVNPIIIDPRLSKTTLEDVLFDSTEYIDWIFVCTPHNETGNIVRMALDYGTNVLAEKPLGRNLKEYEDIISHKHNEFVNVGFNYRYYKGIKRLLQDINNGWFGRLVSVSMVLGLGDAPGSEKTWRLDKENGFGALLDPGIHLIDLAMLISKGTLKAESYISWSGFWNTGIHEESHLLASDDNFTVYNIQASKLRWKNILRIEVNGITGYGIVEGRNRYYGPQTYRRGLRWGWKSGKSQDELEEVLIDYDGEDSFLEEIKDVFMGYGTSHEANEKCLKFYDTIIK